MNSIKKIATLISLVSSLWFYGNLEARAQDRTQAVFQVDGPKIVNWQFIPQYRIRAYSSENSIIEGDTDTWIDENNSANLEGIIAPYHAFDSWENVPIGKENQNPLTFQVTDAYTNIILHTRQALAEKGTPQIWLYERLGITNYFDEAESEDPDRDGKKNWEEYQSDTDPNDPRSYLKIGEAAVGSSHDVKVPNSSTNCRYFADASPNLQSWLEKTNALGNGSTLVLELEEDPSSHVWFYRIRARREE